MVPRPKVSIIIACKNNAAAARECLQSVRDQTYPNIELIVIDNFSTDGTTDIAREYTDHLYQLGPERSTQFNFGFTKSTGELIYRIGMEFVLEPDLVEKAVAKIHQGYDALAIHNRSIGDSIWAKVRYYERESYKGDNSIVAVRFMKREVFAGVGGFDESLVAGEDFDLHNRIVAAGYKWDHLDATETHIGEPKTIKDVWDKFYYYGRTIRRYQTKSGARGKKQLGFFRPSFKKLQRDLLKTPKLFVAFWFYMVVKYAAGAAGVLRGAPESLQKTTTTPITTKEPTVNPASNPLVSVIVPTKNSAKFLDACLESIKSQTYPHIELIVVDNHSTDTTLAIAKRFTSHVFTHGPERSAQRNHGVTQATGAYIAVIDSDMELTPSVIESCVQAAAANPTATGIIIPEESFGKGFWAQCKALERSYYVGNDSIEGARFVPKAIYDQIKGFDTTLVAGEDWDFSARVRQLGPIARTNSYIRHNEGHPRLMDILKKRYYYAQHARAYLLKNPQSKLMSSVGPLARYKLFLSQPIKLFRHPIIGTGVLVLKAAEYAVGAVGYLSRSANKGS